MNTTGNAEPYKSGADMWSEYKLRYGDDATGICNRYLDMQLFNKDPEEIRFCKELYAAMPAEPILYVLKEKENDIGITHQEVQEMPEMTETTAGMPELKTFEVSITETLQMNVTVEAYDSRDAEQIVTDRWNESKYILDADNFIGADFVATETAPERDYTKQPETGGNDAMNSDNISAPTRDETAEMTQNGSVPFAENEYVKGLYTLLRENGRDTTGLSALLGYCEGIQDLLKSAEDRFAQMNSQLDDIKEIQNNPLKAALRSSVRAQEEKIAEVSKRLAEMKASIIEGCKNVVAAFKNTGVSALNNIASFFNIKSGLQDIKRDINHSIVDCVNTINKIDRFSREYHETGRHLKNMARIAVGRQPVSKKKAAGKLARIISAPYRAEKAGLLKIKKTVNAAIMKLEQLEFTASVKQAEREIKPMLSERLKTNLERVERERTELAPGRSVRVAER
ncbi:MAG: DpnD/PcfM family protein [Oscillospiraceae bacterium]|jgi:hypothetical protein|nr:DpnD/PcfM family protein [Oscillospiraceae bacterium]